MTVNLYSEKLLLYILKINMKWVQIVTDMRIKFYLQTTETRVTSTLAYVLLFCWFE